MTNSTNAPFLSLETVIEVYSYESDDMFNLNNVLIVSEVVYEQLLEQIKSSNYDYADLSEEAGEPAIQLVDHFIIR